jgi:hypothetical protein
MPLYLHCAICNRKQADGLLSSAAWGRVEPPVPPALRVCPSCMSEHPDWATRALGDVRQQSGAAAATG